MIGGALFFDGDNDFGEVAHDEALNLSTEATVSVWLRPVLFSGGSDFDRVIRKDVNYDFTDQWRRGSGARHRQDTVFFTRRNSGSGNVAAFCVRRPQRA